GGTADGTLTPEHVYTRQGSYSATLAVTDTSYGFCQSSSLSMVVNAVPPNVTITGPSSAAAGSPVNFTASISAVDPEEVAAGFSCSWNFGDGATSTAANPTRFFSQAGPYTVTLSVRAQDGATGTGSLTVNVASAGALTYTLVQPYPASGIIGTASGAFTVALPAGQLVPASVTVTPNDQGAGGTFTPATVVLSHTTRAATFTYPPATGGLVS